MSTNQPLETGMFCPKCGAEAVAGQKFCKHCGTDLGLINDVLRSGENPQSSYNFDADALKRSATEFARSFKAGIIRGAVQQAARRHPENQIRQRIEERRQLREEIRARNWPRPKEWLAYSWQHNLRNGLLSLFGGAGLGFFLYFMSRAAIDQGLVQQLEDLSQGKVHGLAPLFNLLWLISLIPVLKGLAQILYAAFFAESIGKLSERFTLSAPKVEKKPIPPPASTVDFENLNEVPSSVTEHTTKIFEEAKPRVTSETQ